MHGQFMPQIIRSSRTSIAVHITPEGKVIVKAPRLIPKFIIEQFLHEKESWIVKTVEKVTKRKPKHREYVQGEEFLFLGKPVNLTFTKDIQIVVKDNALFFPEALVFRIQKELPTWFKKQAQEVITQRVIYHAKKMTATYKDIFFSDTQSKWGTCFADNTLQFNWRLIMAPLLVIDYVVIHELTHTTEKHHQAPFWAKVRLYTPAYKQHRKWLEEHAHLLIV